MPWYEVISVLVASEKDWENPVFQFTSLYQNVKAGGCFMKYPFLTEKLLNLDYYIDN